MKTTDLIDLLVKNGYSYNRFPRKNWRGKPDWQHFLMKGDCRIKIQGSLVEIEFVQSKQALHLEGNLLGPFRDGVMFDVVSREMVR